MPTPTPTEAPTTSSGGTKPTESKPTAAGPTETGPTETGPTETGDKRRAQGAGDTVGRPGDTARAAADTGMSLPSRPGEVGTNSYANGMERKSGNVENTLKNQQRDYDRAMIGLGRGSEVRNDPAQHVQMVRDAVLAGYDLAELRLYYVDDKGVAEIVDALQNVIKEFDKPNPAMIRPDMLLSVTRVAWMRALLADFQGHTAEFETQGERVRKLTQLRMRYMPDAGPLTRLRHDALRRVEGTAKPAAQAEICKLGDEFEDAAPGDDGLVWLGECDLDIANTAIAGKNYGRALQRINAARDRIVKAQNAGLELSMEQNVLLVEIENLAAQVAIYQQNLPERSRRLLAAAAAFREALSGKTYLRDGPGRIRAWYNQIKELDASLLADNKTISDQNNFYISLFTDLSEAVEKIWSGRTKSPSYSMVEADSLSRLAYYQIRVGKYEEAAANSTKALDIFKDGEVMASFTTFSEEAADVCGAGEARVRALLLLQRNDDALTAHKAFEEQCGEWLRRYPWDSYARQRLINSQWRMGSALKRLKRYAEAIPLLQSASDWGDGDASTALASMYRGGLGVPANPTRAAALDRLSKRQQPIQLTVNATFGTAVLPFIVTARQFGPGKHCAIQDEPLAKDDTCVGFDGVDEQVKWLDEARNGKVDPVQIEALRRADRESQANGLSFPVAAREALNPSANRITSLAAKAIGNDGRGKSPPPPGPIEITVAPTIISARLYAFDESAKTIVYTDASQVSRKGPARCYGWSLAVARQPGRITLREDLTLPGKPGHMPNVDARESSVLNGGQLTQTKLVLPMSGGLLSHNWCASADDALGTHRIDVWFGAVLLKSFTFELIE